LLSGCEVRHAAVGSTEVTQVDDLIVQPVGGFVGAGGPGHVKSEGRIAMSALSSEDRAKVDALFSHPPNASGNFYYRITRGGQTVNVPPEAVPAALIASVKTVLE
jgi:hypothetical protein